MGKFLFAIAFLCLIGVQSYAQKTVTGTVTAAKDGSTLPGVTVMVKGTQVGTITDSEGTYKIEVPETGKTLVFSFIGMQKIEKAIGDQSVINAEMVSAVTELDELVVSAVASGTQRRNLTVTVDKIDARELNEVPATSAASALQGKVAGASIISTSGNPGQAALIKLRGATSVLGSQEPLIIVDGVRLEGTLEDLNVDDIENIEIVKGASASALYGSEAGNGVVVISTGRGSGLEVGETKVKFRNEYGFSQIGKKLDLAEHHPYQLEDPSNPGGDYTNYLGVTYPDGYSGGWSPDIAGSRVLAEDDYIDNPYAYVTDVQDEMFKTGQTWTNYVQIASRKEKTNFAVSYENFKETGVIALTDGYTRNNVRANIDHNITDNLKISASNMVGFSETQDPGGQSNNNPGVFMDALFLEPDIDLHAKNENGQKYDLDPSFWNDQENNPLYQLEYENRMEKRNVVMGNYNINYQPFDWLDLDGKVTFERRSTNYTESQIKDYLARSGSATLPPQPTGGYMYKYNSLLLNQTHQFTANLNKQFGKLTTKAKFSYLYEDMHYENFDALGYEFSVIDVPDLDATEGDKFVSSEEQDVRARNFFGVAQFNYDSKYLADVMYRYDGSSLFGENERWHPYYRISGAWRITENYEIPQVEELKIRSAYGTSGQRPGYYMQYETYAITNGAISKQSLGNKDLKPSQSKEFEVALNAMFLDRFLFDFAYSFTETSDEFIPVPQSAAAGFPYKWENAATLEGKAIEAKLGIDVIEKKDFNWDVTFLFDRVRQKITKLDAPPFQTGPAGQEANQAFYVREGETFGIIYGSQFATELSQIEHQLADGETLDDYEINSDGYVVPAGSQGTVYEIPVQILDENGNPEKREIGNTNPEFNLRMTNNLTYKQFSLYFLFDWKNGGDVYNKTKQWLYRDMRSGENDVYGLDPNEKKTKSYYDALYDVNQLNSHFVEDASYLKLRELSLSYRVQPKVLENFIGGAIKEAKLSLVGRNLLTFTNYTGFDPEVAMANSPTVNDNYAGSTQYYAYDSHSYPNFRSYSISLNLTF